MNLRDLLLPSWPLFTGEQSLDSQSFYQLIDQRTTHWRERGVQGRSVGLPPGPAISWLADFFALSCLQCPVLLLPPDSGEDFALGDSQFSAPGEDFWQDSRFVVLTSGTSGGRKGVVHNWGNLRRAARGFAQHFGLAHLAWGQTLPLYHVAGLMSFFRPLFERGRYVLGPDLPSVITQSNVLSLVPTQVYRLRERGQLPLLQKCDLVLVGGDALGKSTARELNDLGVRWSLSYGLTEMMATVACDGRPLPGREVSVDCDGVISVDGPGRFLHYLGEGPWKGPFATQDLGEWDSRGRLRILGRRDDVFQCGGENVHPRSIEEKLLQLPGVQQAKVVPRPDPQYGAVPWAFIQASPMAGEDCYRRQLQGQLPGLLIPRRFLPLAQLADKI